MSSVFFGVNDRYFSYSHVIGRGEYTGSGFRNPQDLALGANDRIYVIVRAGEHRLDGIHVTVCTFGEEYIAEFGSYGEGNGQFIWPVSIALDSSEHVYVVDAWLDRITVFTKGGEFVGKWGQSGSGAGELNRPSGLAISADGTVYVVDSRNHRVQKFTDDGEYLGQFGGFGSEPGSLNFPWGIAVDGDDLVYVADWRNDRIQQFTADGESQAFFGRSGNGPSEFNRPAGVAIDQDGDMYVADWRNNRVQVLTRTGRFITEFTGEATLSKWGKAKLAANPQMVRQRSLVRDLTPDQKLWFPSAVKVDEQGRIAIVDGPRHRIQVYQKHKAPVLA